MVFLTVIYNLRRVLFSFRILNISSKKKKKTPLTWLITRVFFYEFVPSHGPVVINNVYIFFFRVLHNAWVCLAKILYNVLGTLIANTELQSTRIQNWKKIYYYDFTRAPLMLKSLYSFDFDTSNYSTPIIVFRTHTANRFRNRARFK